MEEMKWRFPSSDGGQTQGINNAGIVNFRPFALKSLAREICQNSLDAKDENKKGEPVIVEFNSFSIDRKNFPGIDEFSDIIDRCYSFCEEENTKAIPFFAKAKEVIAHNKIKMLRISDFNTKGLTKKNWARLVTSSGISAKENNEKESVGGSFGIGKNAPFACSDIQTILYSSIDIDGEVKSEGVAELTSFKKGTYENGEDNIAQSVGFYGIEKEHGVKEINTLFELDSSFQRKEPGTDIYVTALSDECNEKLRDSILAEVLDSFLVPIWQKKLEIIINGEKICYDNLLKIVDDNQEILNKYNRNIVLNCHLLFDGKEKWHEFPVMLANNQIGKVKLIFKIMYDGTGKIAMVREMGMRIHYQGNFSNSIAFVGVAIVEGSVLNKMLVDTEDVAHTSWKPKDDVTRKIIRSIYNGIANEIETEVKKSPVDQLEIEGAGDLIPDIDDFEDEKEENQDKGNEEVNKIINIDTKIIEKPQDVAHLETDEKGDDITSEEEAFGQPKPSSPIDTFIHNGGNQTRTGGRTPTPIDILTGEVLVGQREIEVKSKEIKFFCKNKSENSYRLIFVPTEDSQKGFIEINKLDEQNNRQPIMILNVDCDTLKAVSNRIGYFKFKTDEKVIVDLKISEKDYSSMEVKLYAYKN